MDQVVQTPKKLVPICLALILISLSHRSADAATVGAYYYPWWGENVGGHTFNQSLRARTTPGAQLPMLGEYSSFDTWTIASHIDQSQAANLSMWSMSWWGPNSFEDRVLREAVLTHPHASRLKYTVHYEAQGRLGDFSNPNYSRLVSDFEYLADEVFDDPNMMRIDDKPAVFMYLSRVYFNTPQEMAQLTAARQSLQNSHGIDLYIIGDHLFNQTAGEASGLDAVTTFDVYGQTFGQNGTTTAGVQDLIDTYDIASSQADAAGVDFVPAVAPGYNDRGVRLETDHEGAPRYYEEFGTGTIGRPFKDQINLAANPNTDADLDHLIMVNSFNEWHEDTQLEATTVSPFTTTDDTANNTLTENKFYEGYGTKYLDILRQNTGGPGFYEIFNGLVGDGNQDGVLSLDDIAPLVDHWLQDSSNLTLKEIANHGDWTLDGVTDLDDAQMLADILSQAGFEITRRDIVVQLALTGDYNADGIVSQADLDVVLLNWGDEVMPIGFNENSVIGGGPFDGLISQNELDGVLLSWGTGISTSGTVVPEPTALAGLGVLFGIILSVVPRKDRRL